MFVPYATLGADYSWARPNLNALYQVGYRFLFRYLSYGVGRNVGKNITPQEANSIYAAGIALGLVWQDGKADPDTLGGASRGTAHGAHAAQMCAELGWPLWRPVFAAIDFNANHDQLATCAEYLRAFQAQTKRPLGVYGGRPQIEYMHQRQVGQFYWQTKAWSGGKISAVAHVYQRNGEWTVPMIEGAYDENVALAPDVGTWLPGMTDTATSNTKKVVVLSR